MAFTLPTFNLVANILRFNGTSYVVVGETVCNLAMGKRVSNPQGSSGVGDLEGNTPILLCPAGTDIRDRSCGGDSDVVECPAGTGRWYAAGLVDDIGKGFDNEHRSVTLLKVGWFGDWLTRGLSAWPAPIP